MPINDYFAGTYAQARGKFQAAARAAGARLTAYVLPDLRGPNDEELAVDVARLGPDKPETVLMLVSATHGVEGFCGSGCQVGYLADELHNALPPGAGTILVHALNPHGFAWLRRVNEDDIDLNRNFQDFSQPLPPSSAYEAIHDWLLPNDWVGPSRQAADEAIARHIALHGMAEFQTAVSGGQYSRPTGLFYGGTSESWSNRTFRRILREHVTPAAKTLAVLDFHTGLGPAGYGEPIHGGPADEGFHRARRWYGPEVTCPDQGTSTSAVITGDLSEAFRDCPSNWQVTHLTLEYGTRSIVDVLTALRADHWLHATADRETPLRRQIKRQIRDAFYVDTPAWKAAVYGRAADFVLRAGRALGSMAT